MVDGPFPKGGGVPFCWGLPFYLDGNFSTEHCEWYPLQRKILGCSTQTPSRTQPRIGLKTILVMVYPPRLHSMRECVSSFKISNFLA